MQTLKRSRSISSSILASARMSDLSDRRASSRTPRPGRTLGADDPLDLADQPPQPLGLLVGALTPASVQITSRSGGESDSMNQRAVSAP